MILISKVRTSASKKINLMALIQTLTISTTTFERMKEKFDGFRQTVRFGVPWIRVVVEKPTARPGGAKEEGRRGRLWSPWTSLSGTAPIRINIQNLDVGFHWFISDRSREITHSLLCNLLSGRSPRIQYSQHRYRPWVFQCTALHCWLVLHESMAELNRRCTYGGFSSIVNAALKKFCRNLFLYFAKVRSLELIIIS